MSRSVHTVALDFGATSGRVILGTWSGGRLSLREVHRFPNAFRSLNGHDYWELGTLWHEALAGLRKAAEALPRGATIASVGVDCWGVHRKDQPAGVVDGFSYGGPQELWNGLAAVGQALVAVTIVLFVLTAARAFRTGEPAGDDPWDAQTLEWSVSSPAPADNFASVPAVTSPEPLLDLKPAGSEK